MELNTKEGLKIISAEINNFQNLDHKLVTLNGKSIVVIGKNGSGKSATLRAIQSTVDSTVVPAKAIKKGEERASVKLILGGVIDGEDHEYSFDCYFDAENQKGRLVVKDKEGNKITSPGAQKSIIEYVSFNIDEFIRKGLTQTGQISKKGLMEQIEDLKRFLTVEEKTILFNLDKESDEIYKERTEINRDIEKINLQVKSYNFSQEELQEFSVDKSEEINILRSKQQDIANTIVTWERNNSLLEDKRKRKDKLEKETSDLQKAVTAFSKLKPISDIDLQVGNTSEFASIFGEINKQLGLLDFKIKMIESKAKELTDIKEDINKISLWLEINQRPSVESLNEQMTKLSSHQDKYSKIQELNSKKQEYVDKNERSRWITERLSEIKQEKKNVFTNSKLPVKGLSFDENGIYYNGLPFNQDSQNSATIINVGLKIAMAMNPRLRCIFIREGSLIDRETFKKILAFVSKENYQLIVEIVDWYSKTESEVVFLEEFLNK